MLLTTTLSLLALAFIHCHYLQAAPASSHSVGYVYWRNATKRSIGSVIPRPKLMIHPAGLNYLEILRSNFSLQFANDAPDQLKDCQNVLLNIDRYQRLLFDDTAPQPKDQVPIGNQSGKLYLLAINSKPGGEFVCESLPNENMDESYELSAGLNGRASMSARTNWGILRGLETMSQLIFQQSSQNKEKYAIWPVQISDEPRFKHRGLMLDTARHYIPMDKILLTLDAMSYNKLNVFHWHLVDDQSFPLVSRSYAQLSKKSAYKPTYIYRQEDVEHVIAYAAMLGIRVLPELDTPGHSYSLRHIPNVLSECYDEQTGEKNGDFGPVDPTKTSAYRAIDTLLLEFARLFADSHFHAGGDEVDFDCWKSSPEISNWMKAHNMSGNYEALSNYYIRKLHHMVTRQHNKTMLVWQEVFDMGANLPRERSIVHVWKNINDKPKYMAELNRVVKAGFDAILSSCWYLNYIDYGQDWIKYYQCDPRESLLDPALSNRVLGGEVCMWTEFVDGTNVISRTWPRASAAAERLWSPAEVKDESEFLHRLEQHRCRLRMRAIEAEPVNGPGYC